MIIILGPQDKQSRHVQDALKQRGYQAAILSSDHFPNSVTLSQFVGCEELALSLASVTLPAMPRPVRLVDIEAVYYYGSSGVALDTECPAQELDSAFGSFIRSLDCRWVNPPEAMEQQRYPFYKLNRLQAAGVRVADSLMTNQPEALLAFYEQLQGNVVCKPFHPAKGAFLNRVASRDLTPEKLAMLTQTPMFFQEYIAGVDLKVIVAGSKQFAFEISGEKRSDAAKQVKLPADVARQCKKIAKTLGLAFCGITFRMTPKGEYVVLDINASPQYLQFEACATKADQSPITQALINCLTQ